MCRLFGFRSVIPSQVHRSLVSADNALMMQSKKTQKHQDGWGVAYYVAGAPHIIKSPANVIESSLFRRVSGIVSSETVLAHLRHATQGNKSIVNTHPFQFGNWVFAQNGNIKNFPDIRELLIGLISPRLRRFILGETDSEVLFFLILSHIERRIELHRPGTSIDVVAEGARDAIREVCRFTGGFHPHDDGDNTETYLTFLLTNGTTMVAHHGGKDLYYSTYKGHCPERDLCPSFASECESPTLSGFINHLILSSEPLQGDNIWIKLEPGDMVGIDWRMQLHLYNNEGPVALPKHPNVAEPTALEPLVCG